MPVNEETKPKRTTSRNGISKPPYRNPNESRFQRGNQRTGNCASGSWTQANQITLPLQRKACRTRLPVRSYEGRKLSPGRKLSNGSQALEPSRASEPEVGKGHLQGLEPSRASEPEVGKDHLQGSEPSRASEPEVGKDHLQGLEPSRAADSELVKADPQGLEPSRAAEPEPGKDSLLKGLEPSRAAEPELGKDCLLQELEPSRASEPELVKADSQGLEPLPRELYDGILGRLPMREVIRLRRELGRYLRNAIYKPAFRENRPSSEGEFSPSFFETDVKGDLHWRGLDTWSRQWTTLPSLNFAKLVLPSPDQDLFKDYLVAGDGGLLCIYVGKASGREKLVVCNPLTQQVKVLPPLNHPRHPVLMHIKVDLDSGHYKVFVAGSAAIGTAEVSLRTEEYDSRKGVWECPDGSDLPCQPFGLNEYQNGVYVRDSERELLMCVAIIDTRGRGVLVYDITKKKWAQSPHVKQLHIPLVNNEPNVSHLATTQIVECGGSVFVFSEQECGRDVYFLIHKLVPDATGDFTWDEVVRRKRTGGRGLLVYPEFTCVPVSEHELGLFNTIEHTLDIVDLYNPTKVAPLQTAPASKRNRFHSLNPIGFIFKPTFRSVVCPLGRNPKRRCDLNKQGYCSECERLKAEDL